MERKSVAREKRIETLSHYHGTIDDLLHEIGDGKIDQRIRTFSQTTYDEIVCALRLAGSIRKAAVVVHGAVGCSAVGMFLNQKGRIGIYSTDLSEKDVILGSEEKLRSAIYRAVKEQHPEIIFIIRTPAVAINNDDINSVVLEMQEEVDAILIPIETDGFQSKCADNGDDIVLHSLLRNAVKHDDNESNREDILNIISVSESAESLSAVIRIMKALQIRYRILPQFSSGNKIQQAGNARASVVLNPDEGGYFAEQLEENFGVGYLRCEPPVGIENTNAFIRKIAEAFGISTRAEAYIHQMEKEADECDSEVFWQDKTFFLDLPLPWIPGFVGMLQRHKAAISGIGIPYVDQKNRKILERISAQAGNITVIVGKEAPFEKVNFLGKTRTDYYITLENCADFAAAQGSIPVNLEAMPLFGYDGEDSIIRLLQAEKKMQASVDSIYKPMYLKRNGSWFVKQEVK